MDIHEHVKQARAHANLRQVALDAERARYGARTREEARRAIRDQVRAAAMTDPHQEDRGGAPGRFRQ